jgi:hypothetical protein
LPSLAVIIARFVIVGLAVLVPMMQIRVMRVAVSIRIMPVPVSVLCGYSRVSLMGMAVMLIVRVAVFVLQRLMMMPVGMRFEDVEQNTEAHERARHKETCAERFIQKSDGKNGTDEGRGSVIRSRAGNSEVP